MSGPEVIEAWLDAWIVESAELPNLYVGVVADLSLCVRVRAINGKSHVPDRATLHDPGGTQQLTGTVTWVELHKRLLHLVVQHAGVSLAVEPSFAQGARRPSLLERLRGYRGMPEFLPVQLPRPSIGEAVELDGRVAVMAEYDIHEIWPGPDVSATYRVEGVDALMVTALPLASGSDEFDARPQPVGRTLTGLTSTRRPEGLDDGEEVSSYRLTLRPV
jgi:hypothetical protein